MAIDKRLGSLVKSILYRILGTSLIILISYIITKEVKIACNIGLLEFGIKTLGYYLFERFWQFLMKWGLDHYGK